MNKTKRKILDTALELFAENGFDGTSVREIAGKVGIRESAIYNHFNSKEDLLKNLIIEYNSHAESLQIINDELLDDIGNPHKFMQDFAIRLIQLWSKAEERKYFRLLTKEQYRQIGDLSISIDSHLKDVRSIWWMIFDELVKYNFVRESDPKLLAEEFLSPLFLYRIEKLTGNDLPGKDKTTEFIIKHVNFFWESARKK